ncbi:hypothetical protein CHS0354_004530 [Potamilus streckersoni]|uniref:Inositol 2-dehydrogenase n=1 Tax=Potamilus streckersoni TaxID=2493646 RepID=A0AAE0S5J6_9BIVA|nr:hypothetical protein CHS0354_004530 [Potamilus streckersoni]
MVGCQSRLFWKLGLQRIKCAVPTKTFTPSLSRIPLWMSIHYYSKYVNHKGKRYNVGVIGGGRIAEVHLPNILKSHRLDLQWVIEDNPSRVSVLKRMYFIQDMPFYTSSELIKLLKESSLDGVFILAPTKLHTEYICKSIQYGKSVFSEKPLGESVSDIKACFDTAEKFGKVLLAGYKRRFDPDYRDVYDAVKTGALGDVHLIKTTTRDSPKPSYEFLKNADSSGCNILADLCVHDVDMITWITGSAQPESIYVNCHINDQQLKDSGEPDTVAVIIKYKHGVLATLDGSRDSIYGYDARLELFGSKGMVQTIHQREPGGIFDGAKGATLRRLHNSYPQRFESAFEAEINHFVDCLDGFTTPLITKEESIITADIIEKGVQSYNQRRVIYF